MGVLYQRKSRRKYHYAEYYHVYNRGTDKKEIFKDKEDYDRFIISIILSNSEKKFNIYDLKRLNLKKFISENNFKQLVSIGSYVLMPNHFHFLIRETKEGGVSNFMKKLGTSYAMYFNWKYDRTGSLFEGKFKSEHVDQDRYLKYLFSYINLNPLKLKDKNWKTNSSLNKKETLDFLKDYVYSSFNSISEERPQEKILNLKEFPKYFVGKDFEKNITDWFPQP